MEYDLEFLLRDNFNKGNLKVYTYEESSKIFEKINEGLDIFVKEQKQREFEANKNASLKNRK